MSKFGIIKKNDVIISLDSDVDYTSFDDDDKVEIDKYYTNKLKNKIVNEIKISKLPNDVNISTMTLTCSFPIKFNVLNIAKYTELRHDGIMSVTYGTKNDSKTNRSLLKTNKTKCKKKSKKNFQNQISIYVSVKGKIKKPVNVKIFKNGSIQMTGCKNIDNAIEVIEKILNEFKIIKGIVRYEKHKVIDKPFVNNVSKLRMSNVRNLKVDMINSNFVMPFKIDRQKLYHLFLSQGYNCLYDPLKHACVNVRYEHNEKSISIFVFEKGSIIITGAKNCEQILDAYNFINKYLLLNHKSIVKNDALTDSNIINFLKQHTKQNESKFDY